MAAHSHIRNLGEIQMSLLLGCASSMANTPGLTISDLANVLAALTEITKPYQFGIQLKIDSSELDSIEKNHPRDVD